MASCIGFPLKIDPLALCFYHEQYARVLVGIDIKVPVPENILAKLKDRKRGLDVSFFVQSHMKNFQFSALCIALQP